MSLCPLFALKPRSLSCASTIGLALALTFAAIPAHAQPQSGSSSHWGVGVSFAPTWTAKDNFRETILALPGVGTVEGSEFTIGIVRGSNRGGDWGVSFVNKPFKDGSRTVEFDDSGCQPPFCSTSTSTNVLLGVRLRGVEVHWSKPFVTIKDRVQIGINIAGGVAQPEGVVEQTFESTSTFTHPVTGQVNTTRFTDTFLAPAKEVLYAYAPLFKFEVQGAVILAPGLKVKVSGGLNMPGTGIRIAAVYLIGAK